jgi:RHS repeat-associated protein
VIGLADGAATPIVSTSYTYEPYGTQTFTGTASTNPFGFTAREFDAANGLQFNRARYTNPTFGRFVSEDPIDIAGGLNLYGYAGNAPTLFTDPLGLESGSCHLEPGYQDTNVAAVFVDFGVIQDNCGRHFYLGVGVGLGVSQTYSLSSTSCETVSAQFYAGGGGVSGGLGANHEGLNSSPFSPSYWNGWSYFGEVGYGGQTGGGIFANTVLNCPAR